jgi:hypothetical protein
VDLTTCRNNTLNSFIDRTQSKKSLNSSSKISMTSVTNSLIFARTKPPRMSYIRELTLFQMSFGKLLKSARNSMLKSGRRSWRAVGLSTN